MTKYGPWRCKPCDTEYVTEEALHQHVHEHHGARLPRDPDEDARQSEEDEES